MDLTEVFLYTTEIVEVLFYNIEIDLNEIFLYTIEIDISSIMISR